jgi:hypothetical protein
MSSEYWQLIKEYCEQRKEDLKAGIISWISEDMSKTIYNKRDMYLKELELIDDFLKIPEYLITRISNQTDISLEDDH